jgi:predicted DNA-binding transcriptional regulator AlpA
MTQQRFYRARDLCGTIETRKAGERGILPFSPALLWRKVKAGTFPKPVKLSGGVTAWPADQVDRWIAERSGERTAETVAA